jgi:hypothetical protein
MTNNILIKKMTKQDQLQCVVSLIHKKINDTNVYIYEEEPEEKYLKAQIYEKNRIIYFDKLRCITEFFFIVDQCVDMIKKRHRNGKGFIETTFNKIQQIYKDVETKYPPETFYERNCYNAFYTVAQDLEKHIKICIDSNYDDDDTDVEDENDGVDDDTDVEEEDVKEDVDETDVEEDVDETDVDETDVEEDDDDSDSDYVPSSTDNSDSDDDTDVEDEDEDENDDEEDVDETDVEEDDDSDSDYVPSSTDNSDSDSDY